MTHPVGQAHPDTTSMPRSPILGAFRAFHGQVMRSGALTTVAKELMALAISLVVGCEDCVELHGAQARRAGATDAQFDEVYGVAVLMGGGPAYMRVLATTGSGSDE